MPSNNILDRGGYKKILLPQAQALALRMVVGRIEDFADYLGHGVLFHRAHVVALIEFLHVDTRRLRAPQTQHAHTAAVFAGHIQIVRHRIDLLCVDDVDMVVPVVPVFLDVSLKRDGKRAVVALFEPDFPARQPEIGQFRLPAVY